MLVYDLGGGTFDVSLSKRKPSREGYVIASDGIPHLGGDDFDDVLALLSLAEARKPEQSEATLTPAEHYLLFDECREKKEALNSNSRKITIDLERVRGSRCASAFFFAVDAFYERCRLS